jgi:multidrug transporter EmrE-like cation transporter
MATLKVALNRNLKSESTTVYATLKTNLFCFCFAFLTIFLFGLKDLKTIGNTPFFLSLCLAVCTLGAQICLMKAIQLGSVAVSALFTYCGFIIPTLWGAVHYQEEVQLLQVLGILMVLVALVLSTRKEKDVKFNKWWFVFACGGLLFSGIIGIIQKIFILKFYNRRILCKTIQLGICEKHCIQSSLYMNSSRMFADIIQAEQVFCNIKKLFCQSGGCVQEMGAVCRTE